MTKNPHIAILRKNNLTKDNSGKIIAGIPDEVTVNCYSDFTNKKEEDALCLNNSFDKFYE